MNNKYKTFGYYLKEVVKIIAFGAVLAWLCSCSNAKKGRIAEELKHVKFDLELLGGELSSLDKQMSSYRFVDDMAFTTNNLTKAQLKERRARAKQSEEDYLELSRVRTRVHIKMIMLKVKYDSLQTEYAKF